MLRHLFEKRTKLVQHNTSCRSASNAMEMMITRLNRSLALNYFIITFSVFSDEPDCKWFKLEDVGLHEDADGLYELKTDDVCNGKYYYKQIKPANGHYLYYLTNGGDRWVGGDYMCEEEIQVFLWGAGDVISPDLVPKNTWKEKLDAASKEFHLDRNITVLCIGQYIRCLNVSFNIIRIN